jgi:lipoyltransferase 1
MKFSYFLIYQNQSILLLWMSEPCIVIGRHQNPWTECNVKDALARKIKVVRRYSGGGCVYHDLGNLNISFICDRLKYNREYNLNMVKNALEGSFKINKPGLQLQISPRHDIFLMDSSSDSKYKISGSGNNSF